MKILRIIGCVGLAVATLSCSYKLGHGDIAKSHTTMHVPYVKGDETGQLTSDLVRHINTSGLFTSQNDGGADLVLHVRMLKYHDETIGYQFDRDKDGNVLKHLKGDENRLHMLAEYYVVDAMTGKRIVDTTRIDASVDYDYDSYDQNLGTNINFSLGQLTAHDPAYDTALKPANDELARKIVNNLRAL
jgi:hypothetical protein